MRRHLPGVFEWNYNIICIHFLMFGEWEWQREGAQPKQQQQQHELEPQYPSPEPRRIFGTPHFPTVVILQDFFFSSFFLIQLKKSENVTGEIPRYIREKVDCVFQWNLIYFFHLLILENKNIISCYTIPKEIVKWLKIKRATFPFQYSVTIHFSSLSILLTLPPHLLSHWRRRWLPYIYSFYQHFYNIILWFHTNIKVLTQKKKEYKKKHKSFKLS